MFAIAYASNANCSFDEEQLQDLAAQAAARNAQIDITGYLFFRSGQFFQYLEGEEQSVRTLLASIQRDDRHDVFRCIELGTIDQRNFADWRMRYVTAADLVQIELEDVAKDILLRMKEPAFSNEVVTEHVLRVVQKISERRMRMGTVS